MNSDTVVECYSGHTYADEPRAFWIASSRPTDGGMEHRRRRTVTVVRGRWREPTGPCFDVLADDGHAYVLAYNETTDCWRILAKANDREFASCSDFRQITTDKEGGQ